MRKGLINVSEESVSVKKQELMTEGTIWKKILVFAVPLIIGNLLQQMYSTIDSIIVGHYVGKSALAAVGSSTSIINLLIAFSQGASVGAGVVISQYMGARDKKSVHSAVHTAAAVAVLLGLFLTLAGVLMSGQLLVWMQTPDDVINDSTLYLRVYSAGLVFNVVYNMATGIMNAAGNSKRPLIYLGAASVTNIVLDMLFIAVGGMGVEGAAIATDVSQAVSCVLAMIYLFRVDADYRISPKDMHINGHMLSKIIKIGLPTGIQSMVISLSNIIIQSSVNSFGSTQMAGFGAYMKVDGFNILPVLSISMAVTTFVGQNYGAGRIDRVKKGAAVTVVMGLIYTALTGILLLTFSEPIMRLFTDDTDIIAAGELAMKYFCPYYMLLSILNVLAGTVRGAGKSVPPMVILLFAMCVFRVLWIKLVLPHYNTIDVVYMVYPVSWVIGAALMALYTWKGKWLPVKSEA